MKINYPQEIRSIDFSAAMRTYYLQQARQESYDLCIIGGGITGAGIAWDATLRGLKTILIEKSDFAAGTSSKSSKLVHGGFRYLKQYEFGLVHEALAERFVLLHLAPHLVTRLPAIFPIYKDAKEKYWQVKAGMILYDLLCGTKRIGSHQMLSATELLELVPAIRQLNLRGGAFYYDAKGDDFRLVMSTIQSAALAGCHAANYVSATGFEMLGNQVAALQARDELTGDELVIRARAFVNATGPWSDQVRKLVDPEADQHVRATLGIHILIPAARLPLNYALMIISMLDDRPLFAIPWQNVILLGTTDTDFIGDPDRLWASREDVDYLLNSFNHYFPEAQLGDQDIVSSFAGLRPLIYESDKASVQVTREHQIFEQPENLFNIIGGKLTTYRRMAGDMLNYLAKNGAAVTIPTHSQTGLSPLYGGEIPNYADYATRKITEIVTDYQLSVEIASHLLDAYGCHVNDLLAILNSHIDAKRPLVAHLPYLEAQMHYALRHEMTVALDDFLIRRTHILSLDWDQGAAVAGRCAEKMAARLGWNTAEIDKQLQRYLKKVELTRKFRRDT